MVLNGCFAGFPAFGSRSSGSPAIGFVWRVPCLFSGLHWLRRAAGCFFSLRLQMKPGERLQWGLESRCKGTTFFPIMQVFRPLFFIKFQIETYSSRNRVSDGVLDGRMTVLGRFSVSCCSCCSCCSYFEAYNCNSRPP